MQMASEAFNRLYANDHEKGEDIWVALAAIDASKTADDQLALLWAGLGTRASESLLAKAINNLIESGDPLLLSCCLLSVSRPAFHGTLERFQKVSEWHQALVNLHGLLIVLACTYSSCLRAFSWSAGVTSF